jgi:hypothetical protein
MALTGAERQQRFRERMQAAGYERLTVWVSRSGAEDTKRITREIFLRKLEKMTAEWSKEKRSKVFGELLSIVESKKEAERKKKEG